MASVPGDSVPGGRAGMLGQLSSQQHTGEQRKGGVGLLGSLLSLLYEEQRKLLTLGRGWGGRSSSISESSGNGHSNRWAQSPRSFSVQQH